MKAKEWVAKLQQVSTEGDVPVEERYAEFLKEYGEETANLLAERTKTSKPESRLPAAEGAVREQRNKFRSICAVPLLTDALFDGLLATACPDYLKWVEAAKKKAQDKEKKDDVAEYRKDRNRQWRNNRPKNNKESA